MILDSPARRSGPLPSPVPSQVPTPAPSRLPAPGLARWALPALLILLVQVALYVWMAPRGFDFTDESYYFHNFLYWRQFTGTVTFFGAYFEWPFRAMGHSIAGIRILSLALVLASSALLMHAVLRFSLPRQDATRWQRCAWLAGPMAASMLYFGFLTTLRAPSYNLLSLATMAVMTACLLRTIAQQAAGKAPRLAPLLYGLALGACFLSKATSALLVLLVHLLFYGAVNRAWKWNSLLAMAGLITAGFAINFILLAAQFPGWLASLREGIEITRMRGGYGVVWLAKSVSWDVQREFMRSGPVLLAAGLLFFLIRRRLGTATAGAVSALTLLLVGAAALAITLDHRGSIWLQVLALAALGLWSLEQRAERARPALLLLLFTLPLAFSFGTNMPILRHSAIASMFALCAVFLLLYRLHHQGLLNAGALAASACLLCAPALTTQVLALTDAAYTYRQYSALGAQNSPAAMAAGTLLLDARSADGLRQIGAMAQAAGLRAGEDMLDFADSPGVVYALGAVPLGTPWLVAGFEGSTAGSARTIEKIDAAHLRSAWLLSTDYKARGIDGWQAMLARRLGPASHVPAGSVTLANPAARDGRNVKTVTLQLWKPSGGQGG